MNDDKTASVAKRAMVAFVLTLVAGLQLAYWLWPNADGTVTPIFNAIRATPRVLQDWITPLGWFATLVLMAAIGFTLFMLWNFLFQVANPDAIVRRELDSREPENPLPHADQLPLEGD